MKTIAIHRLFAIVVAVVALAGTALPVTAHNGARVFTGQWDDVGCYEFPDEDVTICQDISGLVHITASPSGVLSFTDQTGGHFTVSIDGTVIQDEEFDSHTHTLVLRGDAQHQSLVYLFDGTYYGLACDGRFIYTIADGELRFDHYVNDCV
jgi:hypothetical protein